MLLAVGLSHMAFIMLRCALSMPTFWRVLSQMRVADVENRLADRGGEGEDGTN